MPGYYTHMNGTIKELTATIGGLSNPSKMPGLSYGIPAKDCTIGSILRKIAGSVCHTCYAHKGMYSFGVVKRAQAKRLAILSSDLSVWQANMTQLLAKKYRNKTGADRVFRWHDSGDLQGSEHLSAIVEIAKYLPSIQFWLPTKEYAIIREFLQVSEFPANLVVRVSAPMIGQAMAEIPGTVSSTVNMADHGFQCPAYSQDGKCGDCRSCWDITVPSVNYPPH